MSSSNSQSPKKSRLTNVVLGLICFIVGFHGASLLLKKHAITLQTEREFMVSQVSQSLKPQTPKTFQLQNAIYQQRVSSLENKITLSEQKTKSVQVYLEPLEAEVTDYRLAAEDSAANSQNERLQLYIDIVSKHRDYQRVLYSNSEFIPLAESESLFSLPSIQLDLVYREGGALATLHNEFINEARDSSFASHYEPQLRRFLAQFSLNTALVECHAQLCAVHLGHQWAQPYYQGFTEIKNQLIQQPWMNLALKQQQHQYRGKGHQIQVWYFGETN